MTRNKTLPHIKLDEKNHVENLLNFHLNMPDWNIIALMQDLLTGKKHVTPLLARADDERGLITFTARVPFDDRFNQTAGTNDLSLRLMEEFLREVGSDLADESRELSAEAL